MFMRWRSILAMVSCFVALGAACQSTAHAAGDQRTILVVGDSLSAEYGLERGTGWVSLVGKELESRNPGYRIENISISGDTTSGGASRLPAALERYAPAIVIIELGSNDALRGLSLQATESNLADMIDRARQAGARVLLVGMRIPPNYGRQYTEQFAGIFGKLSADHHTALVPFLLEGIASDRNSFQADGLHPNEGAQRMLADNVRAVLEPMLKP